MTDNNLQDPSVNFEAGNTDPGWWILVKVALFVGVAAGLIELVKMSLQ